MSNNQKNMNSNKSNFTPEQIEAMARILNASKLTFSEKLKIKLYSLNHIKINYLCNEIYGFSLMSTNKDFRKRLYVVYGEDKIFKNYSNTHLLCLTKCDIMDTDWKNYLTRKGGIK